MNAQTINLLAAAQSRSRSLKGGARVDLLLTIGQRGVDRADLQFKFVLIILL